MTKLQNGMLLLGTFLIGFGWFIRSCNKPEHSNIFGASWCNPDQHLSTLSITPATIHCTGCYMLGIGVIFVGITALLTLIVRTNNQTELKFKKI